MNEVEQRVERELVVFASDEARQRFDLGRVQPQTISLEDVYGNLHDVSLIAAFGSVKIGYRLLDCEYAWGVIRDGDPIADFSWYLSMWDAFLAAGLWPVPEGYEFD